MGLEEKCMHQKSLPLACSTSCIVMKWLLCRGCVDCALGDGGGLSYVHSVEFTIP